MLDTKIFDRLKRKLKRYKKRKGRLPKSQRFARDESSGPRRGFHLTDTFFINLYDQGVHALHMGQIYERPRRFFNLVQFMLQTVDLNGLIVECGCYRGLSSYLMLHHLKRINPDYQGENYQIFDSFQGISAPGAKDSQKRGEEWRPNPNKPGKFAATLEKVSGFLSEFKSVTYKPGWIPQVFEGLEEAKYKFVHIDLDLYEPIKKSAEYFYPRMVPGGIILFDDYGRSNWPGATIAVDEFCAEKNIRPLLLSTGQAVIQIKHS